MITFRALLAPSLAFAGLAAFASGPLTPSARADFNCGQTVCADIVVQRGASVVTDAEANGPTLTVYASYQFPSGGRFTNVSVTIDPPQFFLGEIGAAPDGWSRTCTPAAGGFPTAIWNFECRFDYTANGGVLEDPGQIQGVLPLPVRPENYATPDGTVSEFRVHVAATPESGSEVTADETTSVTMHSHAELYHFPADGHGQVFGATGNNTIYGGVTGGVGDTDTGPDLRARTFSQVLYIQNYDIDAKVNGSRSIVDGTLRIEIPSTIIYRGWRPIDYAGAWTEVPAADRPVGEQVAVIGERGGVLRLKFNGAEPLRFWQYPNVTGAWWPLGTQGPMLAWNSSLGPLKDSSAQVYLDWAVDCDDLPLSSGLSNTTEIFSSAKADSEALEFRTYPPLTGWVGGDAGGPQNQKCFVGYTSTGMTKSSRTAKPPAYYRRSGSASDWTINVAPPTGVFEIGPTTVIDKIPPFERLLGVKSDFKVSDAEWTPYVCRFGSSAWQGPLVKPLTCTNSQGVLALDKAPCFGLDYYLAYEDASPDPKTFHPNRAPWLWDSGTQTGCVTIDKICPQKLSTDGLNYSPQTCTDATLLMNAADATHIIFSTVPPDLSPDLDPGSAGDPESSWVNADPALAYNTRPAPFEGHFIVVAQELDGLPADKPALHTNVQNTFRVVGGEFVNPQCTTNQTQDFETLEASCPAVGPCADLCGATSKAVLRSDLQNTDDRAFPKVFAEGSATSVPRNLSAKEAVWASCGSTTLGGGPQQNPRWSFRLPPGFEPRSDAIVGSSLSGPGIGTWGQAPFLEVVEVTTPVADPHMTRVALAGELRGYHDKNAETPDLELLALAGVKLQVSKVLVDAVPFGDVRGDYYQYDFDLVADSVEASFDFYSAARDWFAILIEPRAGYPFVAGQDYKSTCSMTGENFDPISATRTFNVPMAPEIRLGAQPTCRPGSIDPSYLVRYGNTGGVNITGAEAIFLVPDGLAFAGSELIVNPNIIATPTVQVTTTADLDAAIAADPATVTWVARDLFAGNLADVTGVRLVFPGTFPAYEEQQLRVDLVVRGQPTLGASFTTRGWTHATGPYPLAFARSEPFTAIAIGQCPVTVELVKRFDSDGDRQIDATDALLDDWTLNLAVQQGSAVDASLLLDENGNPAPNGHESKSGVTVDGRVTFLAWPGQELIATETQRSDTAPFGPYWSQVAPASDYAITVGFEPESRTFLNDCACSDAGTCGGDDACVAPGVCVFGALAADGTATTTTQGESCAPAKIFTVVEDEAGTPRGAFVCWHEPTGDRRTWCAASAAGAADPTVAPPQAGAELYIDPALTCR